MDMGEETIDGWGYKNKDALLQLLFAKFRTAIANPEINRRLSDLSVNSPYFAK